MRNLIISFCLPLLLNFRFIQTLFCMQIIIDNKNTIASILYAKYYFLFFSCSETSFSSTERAVISIRID